MSGSIRRVVLLALAGGMVWGCGGDGLTTSHVPESGPSVEEAQPSSVDGRTVQALGKLATNGKLTDAVLVAAVRQDGQPLGGVTLEVSRSVSGLAANYAWSGETDDGGGTRVEIRGDNVSGYYQARAVIGGDALGSWSSIPINGGYEVTVDLPVGGAARVTGLLPLSASRVVRSWALVGTGLIESASENMVNAIVARGLADSADAATLLQEFTAEMESSLGEDVGLLVWQFNPDRTFEIRENTEAQTVRSSGIWSVSGDKLKMVDEAGITTTFSFRVDGNRLTLTFTAAQYIQIFLQGIAALIGELMGEELSDEELRQAVDELIGELTNEEQGLLGALSLEDDWIRFHFEAQ